MKKIITLTLGLILMLLSTSLFACRVYVETGEYKVAVGTYKFYSYNVVLEGTSTTYNIGDATPWGDEIFTEESVVLILEEDRTFYAEHIVNNQIKIRRGTWDLDGETMFYKLNVIDGPKRGHGTFVDGVLTKITTNKITQWTYTFTKV